MKKVRGRFWLGFWLGVFLVVSVAVVARQRAALFLAEDLNSLRDQRMALEASAAEYEQRIQEGSSRAVLVPKVEARLNLRVASDNESTTLRLRTSPDSGS